MVYFYKNSTIYCVINFRKKGGEKILAKTKKGKKIVHVKSYPKAKAGAKRKTQKVKTHRRSKPE